MRRRGGLSSRYGVVVVSVLLAAVLVLGGCKQAVGGGGGGEEDDGSPDQQPTIDPPAGVAAAFDADGAILVSWEAVDSAQDYIIYRSTNGETFAQIAATDETAYADTTFDGAAIVSYAVAAAVDDLVSSMSESSGELYEYVAGVTASRMEYDDEIVVSWRRNPSATTYVVYRRDASEEGAYVQLAEVASGTEYVDDAGAATNAPEADTGYRYQVRWINAVDGVEYNASGKSVFGIYSETVDHAEPNDDPDEVDGDSVLPDEDNPAMLYRYSSVSGDVEADTDWYRRQVTAEETVVVTVEVNEPSGTITSGDILLRARIGGVDQGINTVDYHENPDLVTNEFLFVVPDGDLLFVIYADPSGEGDFSVGYTVSVDEGLGL